MDKRKVCLYTQTHWDREWYWGFEKYRTQLVSVARMLVKELHTGGMPVFHLDGQSCALEDILEMEPLLKEPLTELISTRKLRVGPWYVLADQMLVSGESLIRNLERGIAVASRYGEPLKVGYLPDTFGHTVDMPRILSGFGIDNAVVWRGVPKLYSDDKGPVFFWISPDGSEVMGYLLPDGYYQNAFQEAQYKNDTALISFLSPYILSFLSMKEDGSVCGDNDYGGRGRSFVRGADTTLIPVGGDHLYPPADLRRMASVLASALNKKAEASKMEIEVDICDLEDYLSFVKSKVEQPDCSDSILKIEEELRTNDFAKDYCRAFMLPGVLSSRLYLKRENRILEERLFHGSEPLITMLWANGLVRYPEGELDRAGKLLLLNQPHDSICGCSVDPVHQAMMTRSTSAGQILDLLERQVQEELLHPGASEWSSVEVEKSADGSGDYPLGFGCGQMDLIDPDAELAGNIVFNTTASSRSGAISFKLAVNLEKLGLKSPGHRQKFVPNSGQMSVIESAIVSYLGQAPYQIQKIYTETDVFCSLGGVFVYKDVCVVEGVTMAGPVPSIGSRLTISSSDLAPADTEVVSADSTSMENSFYKVEVSGDGKLVAALKQSPGKEYDLTPSFRDLADAGDSYNFDPVFGDQPIYSTFKSFSVVEEGSLVASIELRHVLSIPAGLKELNEWQSSEQKSFLADLDDVDDLPLFARSEELLEHEIVSRVSLKAGDPIVYFDCTWENLSKDHRLELLLPTGAPVQRTWAENHFCLVEREVVEASCELPVPRAEEAPLDRYPCQRFFVANDQLFLNSGMPEYGVDKEKVSITILRAFSMLSRKRLLTRGGGAGPYLPTPEGNCLGSNRVSLGWSAFEAQGDYAGGLNGDTLVRAYELAEAYNNPLLMSPVSRQFENKYREMFGVELTSSMFHSGSDRLRISACYKLPGENSFFLRLLNVTDEALKTKVGFDPLLPIKSVNKVTLSGNSLERLNIHAGEIEIEFGSNELATLRVDLASRNSSGA